MAVSVGYKFKAKFIKHRNFEDNKLTSFSIGDKVKGANPIQWQNYNFTVWGKTLSIADGDEVEIKEIKSIQVNRYNGKNYFNIAGEVEVIEQQKEEFEDEAPPVGIEPEPEEPASGFDKPKDDYLDDTEDTNLPFDL